MTDTNHECLFPEEQEPSGRVVLAPCLACGIAAGEGLIYAKAAMLSSEEAQLLLNTSWTYDGPQRQELLALTRKLWSIAHGTAASLPDGPKEN